MKITITKYHETHHSSQYLPKSQYENNNNKIPQNTPFIPRPTKIGFFRMKVHRLATLGPML
jgi:hypothetical protein